MNEFERDLYQTKWWDYRLLMPKQATLAFALAYFKAMGTYKISVGENAFTAVVASRRLDPKNPETWTHWKIMTILRQRAAGRGARYEDYWQLSFEGYKDLSFKTRLTAKGLYYIRTNVFNMPNMLDYVERWHRERCGKYIRYSNAPFFSAGMYRGHPLQDAYYEAILSSLSKVRSHCTPDTIRELINEGKLSAVFLTNRATKRLLTKGKAA